MPGVFGLFRSHVIDRADRRPRRGEFRRPVRDRHPRQSEVQNLDRPRFVAQQIRRLDVAMHDPLMMRVIQPQRGLPSKLDRPANRQLAAASNQRQQVGSIDVLHHQESPRAVEFRVQCFDDVRMRQLRRRLHLAIKSLSQFRTPRDSR